VLLAGLIAARPELRLLIKMRHLGLQFVRNGIHFISMAAWALSLTLLPLATVFALEFTMPAWTTILAVLLLGERLNISRVGVIVMGFLGVLIIIRPGIAAFDPASLLVLAAAFGYAVTLIATKKLVATESAFAIIFWMNVMQFPMALIGSDPLFVTKLGIENIPTALGIGVAGLASHYCLSNAFRSGDASIVVPMDFLRIPLIAVIGWWVYGERIDVYVFAGAGLIIAGVLWNLHYEAGRARAARHASG
jgi:drug/metabolite transporter (DMT)-like permease